MLDVPQSHVFSCENGRTGETEPDSFWSKLMGHGLFLLKVSCSDNEQPCSIATYSLLTAQNSFIPARVELSVLQASSLYVLNGLFL